MNPIQVEYFRQKLLRWRTDLLKEADGTLASLSEGGIHEADIYDGELLDPGMSFDGPAIVETKGSTAVVHPGNELAVDDYGNLVISITLSGNGDGNE